MHKDRVLAAMASAPTLSVKHKSLVTEDFQLTGLQPAACKHNAFSCYLFFVYSLFGALVYSSVDSTGEATLNLKPSLH